MAKVKVVLDTNVYISWLLWIGIPHKLIQATENNILELITTPAIIEEVHDTLTRPKFQSRIFNLKTTVGELIESLLCIVKIISVPKIEAIIKEDPDNDKILACAIAAHAQCIISGDAHLLELKRYKGISILQPKQFWHKWIHE